MESHLHTLKESQRYKAGGGTPVTELGKQSLLSSRAVPGKPEPQHRGMAACSHYLFWMWFQFLMLSRLAARFDFCLSTEILSCQLGQEVGPILFTSTKTEVHWLFAVYAQLILGATLNCAVTTPWTGLTGSQLILLEACGYLVRESADFKDTYIQ